MSNTPHERFFNLDLMRVIAMGMVLVMHSAIYNFSIRLDFFATKLWVVTEPIAAIAKTCVLLFFMVSGYLVIPKNRSIKDNFTKTIHRIIIPLIVFSLVNLLYNYYRAQLDPNSLSTFWFKEFFRITSFPSSPLWFLVVLTYLYLLNPVWQIIFTQDRYKSVAIYLTKLAFMFTTILMLVAFPSGRISTIFNVFTAWIGYTWFYLYGGLVANRWVNFSHSLINKSLIMGGLGLTILGDYLTGWAKINHAPFPWIDYTGNFLSLPVMLLAVGIFNTIISANFHKTNQHFKKAILFLAAFSFGIYLTHTYIVSFLTDVVSFNFDQISINPYLYLLVNFAIIFFSSLMITFILKKIPVLKRIIGQS